MTIWFTIGFMILHHEGFPIRKSTDQCLFTAPRGLSQLVTSFFGSWCQGIHLMLFVTWTYCSPICVEFRNIFLQIWLLVFYHPLVAKLQFLTFFLGKTNFYLFLLLSQYLFVCFIRFSMIICTTKFASQILLVGLDGFEPSTSRLSGARSNHLSYRPWWRWWDSNPWPPACRAGALPTELHPHGYILLGLISPWKLNNKLAFPSTELPLSFGFSTNPNSTRHPWDISRSP